MRTIARFRGGPVVAVIAAVTLLSGCTSEAGDGSSSSWVKGARPAADVVVEKASITSTLALPAKVVTRPRYTVVTPVAGRFQADRKAKGVLKAGAVIGWVTAGGKRTEITVAAESTLLDFVAAEGSTVPAGLPVANLQASGFGVRAEVAEALQYRLQKVSGRARMQIDNGPGPVECTLLGPPGPEGDDGGPVSVTCAPPDSVTLFRGLVAILAVTTGEAKNVPSLPATAVAGTVEKGLVNLRQPDGSVVTREVELGITDGTTVEIRSGLRVGDHVQAEAPGLARSRQG